MRQSVEAGQLFGCGATLAAQIGTGVHEEGPRNTLVYADTRGLASFGQYESLPIHLDQELEMLCTAKVNRWGLRSAIQPCKQ